MTRSYKNVLPKKYWVYSVEDLMRLYSVSANTVSNWVKEGLNPSDARTPYVFQGAAVQQFHKARRARTSTNLKPGQFLCFACKALVFPDIEKVCDVHESNEKHMFKAVCPDCSAQVWKVSNDADRRVVEDCRNPNTTRHCLHEDDRSVPSGIWISSTFTLEDLHTQNDRIIYQWLTYAGRFDTKTTERHLASIRYSEGLLAGKPFSKFTRNDVAKIREDLKRRADTGARDSLSSSSIKHIVSHLSKFFTWLLKQEGFKSLPQDLPDYLPVPQAVLAAAAHTKLKDYPSLEEAELMLGSMPSRSLFDLRARAIFALAFLGALRADTLTSLRIKHVDISRRLVAQDAKVVRAKGGKSLNILWFPIPKCFETAVTEWIAALKGLGFASDDALFPDADWLKHRPRIPGACHKSIPVMSTTHAVTEAFAIACRERPIKFTPHSAKHCIGAERDIRSLTNLERKAWSENMAHENDQITERHYGKLSQEQRFEVLEHVGTNVRGDAMKFSDAEKIALFDSLLHLIQNK